jgi:hypothetical protein
MNYFNQKYISIPITLVSFNNFFYECLQKVNKEFKNPIYNRI